MNSFYDAPAPAAEKKASLLGGLDWVGMVLIFLAVTEAIKVSFLLVGPWRLPPPALALHILFGVGAVALLWALRRNRVPWIFYAMAVLPALNMTWIVILRQKLQDLGGASRGALDELFRASSYVTSLTGHHGTPTGWILNLFDFRRALPRFLVMNQFYFDEILVMTFFVGAGLWVARNRGSE